MSAHDNLFIVQVLQYVLNRFLLTSMSLVFHALGCYVEGDYSLDSPYLYLTLVNSLSQTYALYSLFLFYYASSSEFKSIKPFEKFLSIKLIIFFSWWQGILIGFLVNGTRIEFSSDIGDDLRNTSKFQVDNIGLTRKINSGISADQHATQHLADGIQDLLICMEMLIAAVAFTYSFPVNDFVPKKKLPLPQHVNLISDAEDEIFFSGNNFTLGSSVRRRGGTLSNIIDAKSNTRSNLGRVEMETMLATEGPAGDMKFNHPPLIFQKDSITIADINPRCGFANSLSGGDSKQQLMNSEELRKAIPKSNSSSSLYSHCSSESITGSVTSQKQKSKSSLKLSPLKHHGKDRSTVSHCRKYEWKGISNNSYYNRASSNTDRKNNNALPSNDDSNRVKWVLDQCCSHAITYFDICLVSSTSLLYFFSSFLFEQNENVQDISKDCTKRNKKLKDAQLNAFFTKEATMRKYYDYHYYHAAPVHEQLQYSGKYTTFQAIYLTLTAGDLIGDMRELNANLIDILFIIPCIQVKKWIKSSSSY